MAPARTALSQGLSTELGRHKRLTTAMLAAQIEVQRLLGRRPRTPVPDPLLISCQRDGLNHFGRKWGGHRLGWKAIRLLDRQPNGRFLYAVRGT